MSALETAAVETETAAMRTIARRGRILVWGVVLPFALLEIGLLGGTISGGATTLTLGSVVRVALEVALVWMTLNGSHAARRVLAFFCGAGLLACLVMMAGAEAPASILLAATAVGYGFAVYVFTFSTAAKVYLDSNGPIEESSSP